MTTFQLISLLLTVVATVGGCTAFVVRFLSQQLKRVEAQMMRLEGDMREWFEQVRQQDLERIRDVYATRVDLVKTDTQVQALYIGIGRMEAKIEALKD